MTPEEAASRSFRIKFLRFMVLVMVRPGWQRLPLAAAFAHLDPNGQSVSTFPVNREQRINGSGAIL